MVEETTFAVREGKPPPVGEFKPLGAGGKSPPVGGYRKETNPRR